MNPHHRLGPWTTSLDAGSRLGLSAFWKRRLEVLPALVAVARGGKRSAAMVGAFIVALAAAPLLAVSDDPASKPHDNPAAEADATRAGAGPQPASAPEAAKFGDPVELTVNDNGHGKYLIDFDAGKLFEEPENRSDSDRELFEWMRSRGIDALGQVKSSYKGLIGFDMIAIPTDADSWDQRPEGVIENLQYGDPGTPANMDARAGLPATFFIQTREGARGVLQITAVAEDNNDPAPDSVRIRYKLIAAPTKRVMFRPAVGKENEANWSPLFRMKEGGGDYLLMAHVPIGGKFPVCLAGTNLPLFSVELVKGSDEALAVKMIPPSGEAQRLWLERDEPVDVVLGSEKYTLRYPTSQVAADSQADTDKATITITWRPANSGSPKASKPAPKPAKAKKKPMAKQKPVVNPATGLPATEG